jgi:hypothetical protein
MSNIKGTILETFLSELSRNELDKLNECNQIKSSMDRQQALRNFFIQFEVFKKVKKHIDPMWLSHDIFLKAGHCEF